MSRRNQPSIQEILISTLRMIVKWITGLLNRLGRSLTQVQQQRLQKLTPKSQKLNILGWLRYWRSRWQTWRTQKRRQSRTRPERIKRFILTALTTFIFAIQFTGLNLLFTIKPAFAATTIAIEPITWDFVGLDSNKPETQGPNTYVVGARVCNLGTEDALNVKVKFNKDGVDNGFAFIQLQAGDTYTFDRIPADNGTAPIRASNYVFDTRANGSLSKSKYLLSATPQYCQDFYYNFEVTRTPSAWNTYQKYYIEASGSNTNYVATERPRQNYIEKLISQARNEVYYFGCDPAGGTAYGTGGVTVQVGDTFTCETRAHTATAYPQMSFTADIPNVIFQVLKVNSTYSNPTGGINSTVYADGCGWVNDPTDPRYHLSPGACSSEILPGLSTYSDQYPYTAPPTEGKGAVGNDIVTRYTIKVLAFPNGIPNPIRVSNVILDYSGSSYHYNADYGTAPNLIEITVANPNPTDLSVTKTHTGNFSYGDNTYTLIVRDDPNGTPTGTTPNGVSAKSPVILTDTLPAGYTFKDMNPSKVGIQPLSNADGSITGVITNWNCDTSGQVMTCLYDTNGDSIGENFPDGGTNTLTLNVNIASGAVPSGTTSTNFARVSLNSAQTDSNTANNTASDPTTVLPNADLAIVKTVADADLTIGGNQTSFVVGRQGTYNLQITNQGNISATTPTVTDTLPAELQFVSAVGTNWTCSATGQNLTCNSSQNLAPAAATSITLTVLVRDTSSTNTTNTGKVSSQTFDSNLTNNSSSVTTPIVRPAPDLSITKTPTPVTLVLNKNSTFNLQVSNVGSDATSGVIQVSEVFPTNFGMQYVSHSGSGWSCIYTDTSIPTTRPCQAGDTTGGTKAINFYNSGPLAAAATSTISLVVKATNDPGTSPQNNTVTVSTPGDTVAGNNTATAAVSIGKPDLAITKSHADPMILSTANDYTITVTNKVGSATTTGPIIVTESLPTTNFTYVSHTGDGWSCIFEATGAAPVSPRACQSGDGTGVTGTAPNTTTRTMKFYNAGPLAAGASSSFTLKVNPGSTAFTTSINNTVVVDTEGEPSTSSTYTDNTFSDPTTANTAASTGRDIAVEKRLTRVSASPITGSESLVAYGATTSSSPYQCSGNLLTAATNGDDFSGADTIYVSSGTPSPASRQYTCPALTAGQYVQYKIAIASAGSGSGTDTVSFSDAVPSILQGVTWSCAVPEPSAGNGSGSNSCGSVTSGTGNTINLPDVTVKKLQKTGSSTVYSQTGYVVITVTGRVNPSATATQLASIINTGSMSTSDADSANNTWSVQHGSAPTPPPDLAIAKTPASQTISNYAQHTFTITPSNISNASSRRITVTDILPTGLDFVSASGTGWTCSYANQILTCFTDNVIATGTVGTPTNGNPITVVVNANSAAVLPVTLTNRVSISTPNETVLNNNDAFATVTINVPVLPNLQVSKTDGNATFTQGIDGIYTVTVNNTGTVAATNTITVTDTLPTGLSFVSAIGTNWTCSNSGQIVLCTTEQDIAASGTATQIAITVKPTIATGTVTNNVRVDTVANGETTTADNTNSDTTPLKDANTKDPNVDLTIAKEARSLDGTSTVTSFQQGQQYRYRLTVTNSGTAAAIAPMTVTDVLPAGLTYLYSVNGSSEFTCSATGQTVSCDRFSDLAASGTAVIDLVVQVNGSATGTLTNPARVTSPSDPCADFSCTSTNNRTSINTTVTNAIDLAIVKTAVDQNTTLTNTQFYQDGTAVYNITVTNNGPSAYSGTVTINENLGAITPSDPNFTYASHSSSATWTCTSGGGSCVGNKNLVFSKTGGLLAGESSTITLAVNVPDALTGTFTNTASIDTATIIAANDTNTSNNSDPETVDVLDNTTALTLEKDDNDGESPDEPTNADLQAKFVKGGVGKYTIVAKNTGSSPAKAPVTISDTLPSGLTYAGNSQTANWSCTGTIGSQNFSCIYGVWTDTDNDGDRFDVGGSLFTQQDLTVGTASGVEILVNVLNSATTSTFNTNVYTGLTTNTASVSGSNFTTVNASEQTAIVDPADLAVTKSISANPLTAGSTGTYSIIVTNNGPGISYPQIYLQDYLPSGLTYSGAASGTAGGDGTWTIVGYNNSSNEVSYKRATALASGATTTITLPVSVSGTPPASVTNFIRVGGFTPEPDYDSVTPGYQDPKLAACDASFGANQPVNNCFALTTAIAGGVSTDLKITKIQGTNNDNPPNPAVNFNTNYSYTLQVANVSSTNAETVTLTDVLPPGLEYVSYNIDAGDLSITNPYSSTPANLTRTCSYTSGTRTFSCNLLRVSTAENDSDPVDITVTTKSLVSGIVPNTATVTSVTADANPSDNSETEDVLINAGGNNTVSGTVFADINDNGTFDTGETGTANITVRFYQDNDNDGAIDADDALIASTSSASGGTYSFSTNLTGNFLVAVDTSDPDLLASSFTTPTVLDVTLGTSDVGNNFGYVPAVVQPGNVIFVKRITAVNSVDVTGFNDDTTSSKAAEDSDPDWPADDATYLRGAIGQPTPVNAAPGDEVEYTVYFLSNGGSNVRDVKFCDLIPAKTTYVPGSIRLGYNTGMLADPSGTGIGLTDGADADVGTFYGGGTTAPSICTTTNANGGNDGNFATNDTGAVFVQIVDSSTNMPYATGAGTPAGSYGFVRFRVTVK